MNPPLIPLFPLGDGRGTGTFGRGSVARPADQGEELALDRGIVPEHPGEPARGHQAAGLGTRRASSCTGASPRPPPPPRAARAPPGPVRDLRRHPLLDLQPAREHVDDPRQLADADNAPVGQVGDLSPAHDRGEVVLAVRDEADVPEQDDLVVAAGLVEGGAQDRDPVLAVAAEPLLVGAGDAAGRGAQAGAVRSSPIQRRRVRTAASASSREGRGRGSERAVGSAFTVSLPCG